MNGIDHDFLKRALVTSLEDYAETFENSATDVEVRDEEPVSVDGRQRYVDVMLTKTNEHAATPTAQFAFEIKTSVGDSVGSVSQLRDYSEAGCQPVLVAADYLFDENLSLLDDASKFGPVVGVATHETREFEFDVISGSLTRVGLQGLRDHWNELVDTTPDGPSTKMDSEARSEVSLPWIYRRSNIFSDRPVTVQLHLQEQTAQDFVEFKDTIEDMLDEDVPKADLREALIIAGIQSPDVVANELRAWGYDVT